MNLEKIKNAFIQERSRNIKYLQLIETMSITAKQKTLDQKTSKLILLAVNNSNINEARNAAMLVCKRLFKNL